jgi:putative transposase
MSVQGVSTRKVKAITEELCGYRFVRFQDLGEQQGLNQALARFAGASWMSRIRISSWMLAIERVREASIIRTRAVLIAIRVTWDGHRQVLAAELAIRESQTEFGGICSRQTFRRNVSPSLRLQRFTGK